MGFFLDEDTPSNSEAPQGFNNEAPPGFFLDESPAAAPTSAYDYVMGGLKGVAKAGTDVIAAPADLMFRGGNYVLDKITGEETDLTGAYPSDYRNKALEFISGGEGDQTTEDVTQAVGNLATVVAMPAQGQNIAAKLPILSKLPGASKLLNLGAGYGAEGAAYGALFNAKSDTLGEDMTTGAALNVAIPSLFKVAGKAASSISSKFGNASKETLEGGLGIQYGDRTRGLNRVNLYVDDAGNTVPFDKIDDAIGIQAPIQLQVKTLEDAGILANAPNEVQALKLHITKAKIEAGNTIPKLAAKADEVIGSKEILPEFNETYKFLNGYRDSTREGLVKQFDEMLDDYVKMPGTGLHKLNKFTDQIQKETTFESAVPAAQIKLRRMVQYDLRRAAEREFDAALPHKAGEFARANEIYSAAESVGRTLNKSLAKKGPSIGDYMTGGSLPMTVMTGAGSAVLGLPAAAAVAGGRLLVKAGQQYSEHAFPISTSKLYQRLSDKAQGVSNLAELGIKGSKASAGLGALSSDNPQESSETKQEINRSLFQIKPKLNPNQTTNNGGKIVKKQDVKFVEAEIDKDLYYSTLYQFESNRDPKAKNPESTAKGGFQFIDRTAKNLGLTDPYDLGASFEAVKVLDSQTKKLTKGDPELRYAAHYLGQDVLNKLLNDGELTGTQLKQVDYLQNILLPRFRKMYAMNAIKLGIA